MIQKAVTQNALTQTDTCFFVLLFPLLLTITTSSHNVAGGISDVHLKNEKNKINKS